MKMTEYSYDDGNYLVRVRAQVMARDDSKGGWVPVGGGGLSNVSVRKKLIPNEGDTKHEYLIYGKRIADQSVVLSCTIKKDFQYNKVMPTFHHWRTGDKKFGLTFQTASDARTFDKGVRMAVEDLLDDVDIFLNGIESEMGDDDVFMTLELPVDSRSSSGSSTVSVTSSLRPSSVTPTVTSDLYSNLSSPYTHPHANHHHLHRMTFIRPSHLSLGINNTNCGTGTRCGGQFNDIQQKMRGDESWLKDKSLSIRNFRKDSFIDSDKIEILPGDSYSYVQLAREKSARLEHEYSYPIMDNFRSGRGDCIGDIKKHHQFEAISSEPTLLPMKSKKRKDWKRNQPFIRSQCRHCLETYTEDTNYRGSCEYAPDGILACISAVTCISCAQCMLYHCMSDADEDFNLHPCTCDTTDDRCHRRWAGLALLSLIVPCLWCYLPLRGCHKCGAKCGLCGGRHEPV